MTTNKIGRSSRFAPKQAVVNGRSVTNLIAAAAVALAIGVTPAFAQMGNNRGAINGGTSQQDTHDRNHHGAGSSSQQDRSRNGNGHDQTSRDSSDYGSGGSHRGQDGMDRRNSGGDNWQQNSDRGTVRYHRTYVRNGAKHYWYNNEEWSQDMSSGHRERVAGYRHNRHDQGNRKYYSYGGHRYYLELGSGLRILID